jgi:hypothetical protein
LVAMVILHLPAWGGGRQLHYELQPRPGGKQAVLGREKAGVSEEDPSSREREKGKGRLGNRVGNPGPMAARARVSPSRCWD